MTVVPLVPDLPLVPHVRTAAPENAAARFENVLAEAGRTFDRAARAETAFVRGTGGLQEMVVERARADILLQVASAAASRALQSLGTILNMQI